MLDVTQGNFDHDVLEASRRMPVLVDFWAPWCGPCRSLAPLLAAAATEFDGRLQVVKLNVDENSELAARYGVRSIPYVVAFVDGQPVDSFVGVLPAEALRQFIGRLLPDPAEAERRKARNCSAVATGREFIDDRLACGDRLLDRGTRRGAPGSGCVAAGAAGSVGRWRAARRSRQRPRGR
jgi:putative thioredoxin